MLFSLDSGVPVLPADELELCPEKTLCFTGHREASIIPYRKDPSFRDLTVKTVRLMLCRYIDMALEMGYKSFISGLAVGTDLWAAEYILEKKRGKNDICLIGAMPYLRHSERFGSSYKRLLTKVEHGADKLVVTNTDPDVTYGKSRSGGNTSPELYRTRNYFMVDNSSAVLAFYNESSFTSGTYQTLNYAARTGRKICRFGLDEVYSLIDRCGADMSKMKNSIDFSENVFSLPY